MRQARTFDSEQIDQARDAMGLRPLHDEILRRSAARNDLRPDAGIARLQRAILQTRPVAPHRLIKPIATRLGSTV